jgi:hypothetical protein
MQKCSSIAPEQKGSLANADPWKGAFRVAELLFHGAPVWFPSSLILLEKVESSVEIKPDEKPAGVTLFSTSSAPCRGAPSFPYLPEFHPLLPYAGTSSILYKIPYRFVYLFAYNGQ